MADGRSQLVANQACLQASGLCVPLAFFEGDPRCTQLLRCVLASLPVGQVFLPEEFVRILKRFSAFFLGEAQPAIVCHSSSPLYDASRDATGCAGRRN
jgi:hypothetical protein